MKDPKRYTYHPIPYDNYLEAKDDKHNAPAGDYVSWQDFEKLKSRLASTEAILKVCFSKQPLKINHFTKNRND